MPKTRSSSRAIFRIAELPPASDIGAERPGTEPAYLTQREAAQYLRVSASYIRSSDCPKVLLPPTRGRRPLVRYLKTDLDAWMRNWRVSRIT